MKLDCFSLQLSPAIPFVRFLPLPRSPPALRFGAAAGPPSRSLCMPAAACLPPWSPRALAALEAAAVAARLEAATLEAATA